MMIAYIMFFFFMIDYGGIMSSTLQTAVGVGWAYHTRKLMRNYNFENAQWCVEPHW